MFGKLFKIRFILNIFIDFYLAFNHNKNELNAFKHLKFQKKIN